MYVVCDPHRWLVPCGLYVDVLVHIFPPFDIQHTKSPQNQSTTYALDLMNKVVELSGVTTSVDEDGSQVLTRTGHCRPKTTKLATTVVDVGANPGAQRLVHSAPAQWAPSKHQNRGQGPKIFIACSTLMMPAAHCTLCVTLKHGFTHNSSPLEIQNKKSPQNPPTTYALDLIQGSRSSLETSMMLYRP